MPRYGFNLEESDSLDENIIEAIEECAERIYAESGAEVRFRYDAPYGINGWGVRYGREHGAYVANVDLSGNYSIYDAWEYGNETEEVIVEHIRELAAFLSPDGQAHAR